MNPDLAKLQPYPFEKLAALKSGVTPPADLAPITLSIGEPKHPTPGLISAAVRDHLHYLATYPTTRGIAALREAIVRWLERRYRLPLETLHPDHHVLPVNGTREALFAFAQAVIDRQRKPLVLMPNPFYQIYEGAALLAGASPIYLPCTPATGLIPNFSRVTPETWKRCQLLYLCSPGNPTGAVIPLETLQRLIELAQQHDFVIAADECYSELFFDEADPPVGLLQAAAAMGLRSFRRCVVFHSLSKRSNAPGLRSGFVAGDAEIIDRFALYRTYHGCAMPLQHQVASTLAWGDEAHVVANRALYREKFAQVLEILASALPVTRPQAGFYLWPETPIDDTAFTRDLFQAENVTVLPGSFLSREVEGENPGAGRIRLALVAPLDECLDAAHRLRRFLERF